MNFRKWFDKAIIQHLTGLLALLCVHFVADYYHFQHRTGFRQTSPYLFLVLLYGWIVFHNLVLFNGLYLSGKKRAYFLWTGLALLVSSFNMHMILSYGFGVNNTLPHLLNFWIYTLLGLGVYVIYRYLKELPERTLSVTAMKAATPAGSTYFSFTLDGEKHNIPYTEIIYLESFENYIKMHTPHRIYLVRLSMKEAEGRLPSPLFLRISRSNIINSTFITATAQDSLQLGTHHFKIGKVYKKYVEEQVSLTVDRQ